MKMIDVNQEVLTERASLSYLVGFADKPTNNNTEDDYEPSALPFEYNNPSPIIARLSAISFMRTNPIVTTSAGKLKLIVYLTDNISGMDYPIYSGADKSKNELENLETELRLYMRYGYPYYGWELTTDQFGNIYRIINNDDWLV